MGGLFGGHKGGSGCCGGMSAGCYGSSSYSTPTYGNGCVGEVVVPSAPVYTTPVMEGQMTPVMPVTPVTPKEMPKVETPKVETPKLVPPVKEVPKTIGMLPAAGTITLNVPAEAKVYVDGKLTTSTSSVRTFETPAIAPNATFQYAIRVELVQDGQTLSKTETVSVKAGETVASTIVPVSAVASR